MSILSSRGSIGFATAPWIFGAPCDFFCIVGLFFISKDTTSCFFHRRLRFIISVAASAASTYTCASHTANRLAYSSLTRDSHSAIFTSLHNFIFLLQKPLKCTLPSLNALYLWPRASIHPFPNAPACATAPHTVLLAARSPPHSPTQLDFSHSLFCCWLLPSSKKAESGNHSADASLRWPAACNHTAFGCNGYPKHRHPPTPLSCTSHNCAHSFFASANSNIFFLPRPPICPRLLLPLSVELASRRSAPRRVSLYGSITSS